MNSSRLFLSLCCLTVKSYPFSQLSNFFFSSSSCFFSTSYLFYTSILSMNKFCVTFLPIPRNDWLLAVTKPTLDIHGWRGSSGDDHDLRQQCHWNLLNRMGRTCHQLQMWTLGSRVLLVGWSENVWLYYLLLKYYLLLLFYSLESTVARV